MQKYLVVICGPTGIGKTKLAVEVARFFKSVIISADSRQIYREMSIGTAVPSPTDLDSIRHEYVQSISIRENYNASMFETEVIEKLSDLYRLHDLVVMTGGSGLYIDAVCNGIDNLPAIDPEIRDRWEKKYKEEGIKFLQAKVKEIDYGYFEIADLNNPKRLLKAIEIFEMTGEPYSSFLTYTKKQRSFHILKIGLNTQREKLYKTINHRVDEMIEAGLLEEARRLYTFRNLRPLNTVGYKELFDYFEGKLTFEQAVAQIKDHSRAYARRQITWFRKDKSIQWFEPTEVQSIIKFIREKINKND
jgi:tRNA dimethylallyltransferase